MGIGHFHAMSKGGRRWAESRGGDQCGCARGLGKRGCFVPVRDGEQRAGKQPGYKWVNEHHGARVGCRAACILGCRWRRCEQVRADRMGVRYFSGWADQHRGQAITDGRGVGWQWRGRERDVWDHGGRAHRAFWMAMEPGGDRIVEFDRVWLKFRAGSMDLINARRTDGVREHWVGVRHAGAMPSRTCSWRLTACIGHGGIGDEQQIRGAFSTRRGREHQQEDKHGRKWVGECVNLR
jgi:hypothetical protein